jgi:hypothetical protein
MIHSKVTYPFICPAASISGDDKFLKAMAWIFIETVIAQSLSRSVVYNKT